MQFQLTRYEYVKTIEFKSDDPILNVESINYFTEQGLTGSFVKKEFRYSWDNVTWTNWNTLTQGNISSIQFRDNPEFYLHVKYTRDGIASGNITGWYLFYESQISPGPTPTPDSSINADYFKGEGPEYYLDRENHIGSYSDLIVENFSNISDASIYLDRIDGSYGSTIRLRTIKGQNGVTVFTKGGEIIIDASAFSGDLENRLDSIDASIEILREDVSILDASVIRIDGSLNFLYTQIGNDASTVESLVLDVSQLYSDISTLHNYNSIQDGSISLNSEAISVQGDEIVVIGSELEVIDVSIEDLRDDISILGNEIVDIYTDISITDASIERIDVSINDLIDYNNIQDSSIISIDSKFPSIEASIIRIDSDLDVIDASIERIDSSILDLISRSSIHDSSIGFLTLWNISQDASIVNLEYDTSTLYGDVSILDASIVELRNRIVLLESSTGELVIWNESQDASIIELNAQFAPIESSILRIDSSIDALFATDLLLESSIIYNYDYNVIQDGSILILDSKIQIQDASIEDLYRWQSSQDASIDKIRIDLSITDSSIERIDSSISDIYLELSSLDASIVALQNIEIINTGDGSVGIYYGRDASNNILLKTLSTRGPVTLIDIDGSILIDSSTVKLYDTSIADDSQQMYVNVGGLGKGTTVGELRNEDYTELLNKMLFPLLDPSLYNPEFSFSFTGDTLYEVDDNPFLTFQGIFNRGKIEINGVFQNDYSGLPWRYTFSGPGLNFTDPTNDLFSSTTPQQIDIQAGVMEWWGRVEYLEGNQPEDSYGNPSGSPLPAGTSPLQYVRTEGVYPLYATSESIEDPSTKQELVSMISGNNIEIKLEAEIDGFKQSFDVAQEWELSPVDRPLLGIETKNPVSNAWIYQGGDPSTSLESWTKTVITHMQHSVPVFYNRYTYNGDDRGDSLIRLKFQ